MTGQSIEQRRAIEAVGRALGPETLAAVQQLYRAEQVERSAGACCVAVDQPYGKHDRQKLDVYATDDAKGEPKGAAIGRPVLLWVHGGGFIRGEKASPDHPFNAHVGHWAARSGMVGVVMNYRLLPDAAWPSGGEDVAAAVAWINSHIATYGGDPARVVVAGTSAGATHVATFLQGSAPSAPVRGAILMSGVYGSLPLETRDIAYLGDPAGIEPARIAASDVPLFLACAEFDPIRFQDETMALADAVRTRHGSWPPLAIVGGHNHFSLACHLGGSDSRLADLLQQFVRDTCISPTGDIS